VFWVDMNQGPACHGPRNMHNRATKPALRSVGPNTASLGGDKFP
jgi:hypothetical protein